METVYIETSIPSYLTARTSKDLRIKVHQQITKEWWEKAQKIYSLFISEAVLEEMEKGDEKAAQKRKEAVKEIPILYQNDEVLKRIEIYREKLNFPEQMIYDLVHIAFAAAYEIDYLVTWNCSHIANGATIRRLLTVNSEMGFFTPVIVTPEELMNEE